MAWWRVPGVGGEFQFDMMKKSDAGENQSGEKWQWWLPNDVNTLNATELYTRKEFKW